MHGNPGGVRVDSSRVHQLRRVNQPGHLRNSGVDQPLGRMHGVDQPLGRMPRSKGTAHGELLGPCAGLEKEMLSLDSSTPIGLGLVVESGLLDSDLVKHGPCAEPTLLNTCGPCENPTS